MPVVRPLPRPDVVALVAYVAVTLAFTFPLVARLTLEIDARFEGGDPLFVLSTLEWERFALLHARDEFFSGNIFFGSGGALFSSDLLLGALPLYVLLLNFALAMLAAMAIHRLAWRPTGRLPASQLPAWSFGAIAAVLVLVESFPTPLPTAPAPVDGDLLAVLESGSRGPTLILPITREADLQARVWINTLAGNGPLVYGYLWERWPVLDGYDRAIVGMSSAEMDGTVAALRVAGVRRIVIVHDRLIEDDAAAWVGLAGHPLVATVVNSSGVTLYELDATAPATALGWAYLDGRVRTQVAAAGTRVSVPLEIGNPGPEPWVPAGDAGRRQLSLGFEDANEIAVTASAQTFLPPPFMRSGATFELSVSFSVPSKPGRYVLIGRIDGEVFLSQNVLMEGGGGRRPGRLAVRGICGGGFFRPGVSRPGGGAG